MTGSTAIERMTAIAEEMAEKVRAIGLFASVECSFMNPFMQSVCNPKKAKFITVSLVISAVDTKKGDEYCLSVGAELCGGKIDADLLEKDLGKFCDMVDEAVCRLSEFENRGEGISLLANEAEAEYRELVNKLSAEHKRQKILSAIGLSFVFIGIIILFIVATVTA